ncbi:MAG TPA: hypothetical protein VFL91_19045 [Thermomicrobiales bacterium]|nr:hypothetical protein [Thermomicrobiales bacterium]
MEPTGDDERTSNPAGAAPSPYGDEAPWLVVDEEWCPWPGFTAAEWRRLVAYRRRLRDDQQAEGTPDEAPRRRAGRGPGRAWPGPSM